MALDILYAESRRRYMQALSPAERESVSGTARADVDEIFGLAASHLLGGTAPWTHGRRLLAARRDIGADHAGRGTDALPRMRWLLPQLCGRCGGTREVSRVYPDTRCLVLAPLALRSTRGCGNNSFRLGLRRVAIDGQIQRIEGDGPALPSDENEVHVVIDRLVPEPECQRAFFGSGAREPLDFVGADGDLGGWDQRDDAFEPAADLRRVWPSVRTAGHDGLWRGSVPWPAK